MWSLRKDEVKVLRQMRDGNEEAIAQQKEMERQRAVERKQVVRESQAVAVERRQRENDALRSKLKVRREEKRQELDSDAIGHLRAYSSLAEEEERLIASLAKWSTLQNQAHEQLDSVLQSSRASSRPVSRGAKPSATGLLTDGAGSSSMQATPRTPDAAPVAAD